VNVLKIGRPPVPVFPPTWPCPDLATLEGNSATDIMTSIGGCGYSFSTPDDLYGGHPKHVEWFCSKINQTAHCCI